MGREGRAEYQGKVKGMEGNPPPSIPDHSIPLELGLSEAQAQSSSNAGSGKRQGQLTAEG